MNVLSARCMTAVALCASMSATLFCRAALAQQPTAPKDSVPKDSTQRDSVYRGPIHHPLMYLIIPVGLAAVAVMVFAPAPFAIWAGVRGPTEMAFLDDHSAAHVAVGGRFYGGQTWANSLHFEVLRKPLHVELSAEEFWRPRHVRYLTARAGYLWYPRRRTAGGVTLGYVHADGDARRRGPELGLPLFVGDSTGTIRLEPTYVISPSGALWSYRLQLEFYFPRKPYFAGATLVGKSLPLASNSSQEDFDASALTVLFGARF
jgi:hypothetical protein